MYNLTELSDYEFLWRTDREAGFMYSILCYMWKEKVYFSKDDIETTLHLVSNDLHMAELWGQFQKSNFYVGDLEWKSVIDYVEKIMKKNLLWFI